MGRLGRSGAGDVAGEADASDAEACFGLCAVISPGGEPERGVGVAGLRVNRNRGGGAGGGALEFEITVDGADVGAGEPAVVIWLATCAAVWLAPASVNTWAAPPFTEIESWLLAPVKVKVPAPVAPAVAAPPLVVVRPSGALQRPDRWFP